MAKVDVGTVDEVARLAELSLTDDERALFARQLQEILAYAESLQALELGDAPPAGPARASERLRDDEERPGLARDEALAAAPDAADRLFRVPRVIGG